MNNFYGTTNNTTVTIPVWMDGTASNGKVYFVPYVSSEEKENMKERTFVMLKPDAFERGLVGEIIDLVSQRGLKMVAFKTVQLTPEDCEKHYSHHVNKDFYPRLVEFMTSGPSLAIVFEGEEAATVCRQLIGNSKHPSQVQAGSIRGRYALDFPRNLIHGSDSYEDARREYRIYLNDEQDIYDDERIARLKRIAEERRAELARQKQERIDKGIKLGEEAFCPEVLKEGDWIVSAKGMSLITKVVPLHSDYDDGDYIEVHHEDYFNGWWKQTDVTTYAANTAERSNDYSWAHSPLILVGRGGQYLSNFRSDPIKNANGQRYIFKEGRWLPLFKKKSQMLFTHGLGDVPFVQVHTDPHGILSDIFDPKNQQVMRIYSKDTDTKWRLMQGGTGVDVTIPGMQQLSETQAIMRLRKVAKTTPGKLTVLLRFGRPYAGAYGQNMQWYSLTGNGYTGPYPKPGAKAHLVKKFPPEGNVYPKKKKA